MEHVRFDIFSNNEDSNQAIQMNKKMRTDLSPQPSLDAFNSAFDVDGDEDVIGNGRKAFTSPSPIQEPKRNKPHANYNPFAREPPSLLSMSTGDSPEPMNTSACAFTPFHAISVPEDVTASPATRTQQQLCLEFKKTLSFVEFIDDEPGANTSTLHPHQGFDSPSTPPSSSISMHFPRSVAKSLRFHHRPQNADNSISRFEDEFETLGKLGGGSFGTVFKVRKRLDGCMYAVKIVKQEFLGKSGRERVLKEVYALAALVNNSDNAHVVRYFSSWIDVDDRLYIQTELCDMSLEELLKVRNSQSTPSDADLELVACDILRQLLTGLKGLHCCNVVHLDIKPANILVRNGTYKLGDLGHVAMARSVRPPMPAPPPVRNGSVPANDPIASSFEYTRSHQMSEEDERQINAALSVVQDIDEGDVRYMPRELLSEIHDHLPKADIFSLAASVYEMFLQKPLPATGEEWAALRDGHLSPEATAKMTHSFKQLLHLMMHPEASKRPTADALLLTGGPGGVLLGQEELGRDQLKREVELLRGLHPAYAVLKRANTM